MGESFATPPRRDVAAPAEIRGANREAVREKGKANVEQGIITTADATRGRRSIDETAASFDTRSRPNRPPAPAGETITAAETAGGSYFGGLVPARAARRSDAGPTRRLSAIRKISIYRSLIDLEKVLRSRFIFAFITRALKIKFLLADFREINKPRDENKISPPPVPSNSTAGADDPASGPGAVSITDAARRAARGRDNIGIVSGFHGGD
ncbi:hypothetical protein EVAR_45850_1 [Eumeta japonica]|uniref:Uncharacterized protein n=1 Tax=Eumeta variegata TaxID=151549 RepID=A0A4C1WL60_EUMVA|nr:hypothetical protein EVAR_45850_1 [Eumeta japonica]